MYNRYDKVRCLEKIVMDNKIGKGLGTTNRWNGNGVRMLALKSIAAHGGNEAIKSLKRMTKDLYLNGELKVCASKFLQRLISSS